MLNLVFSAQLIGKIGLFQSLKILMLPENDSLSKLDTLNALEKNLYQFLRLPF